MSIPDFLHRLHPWTWGVLLLGLASSLIGAVFWGAIVDFCKPRLVRILESLSRWISKWINREPKPPATTSATVEGIRWRWKWEYDEVGGWKVAGLRPYCAAPGCDMEMHEAELHPGVAGIRQSFQCMGCYAKVDAPGGWIASREHARRVIERDQRGGKLK
jgi:hypothetical protein